MIEDAIQKQLRQQEHLLSMFPGSTDDIERFPSLAQCVGTKRLWSDKLGLAFWLDVEKKKELIPLENIAYLSRSYLVIDDFMKDESIDHHTRDIGRNWLKLIKNIIKRNISRVGGDPYEFDEQLMICERSFNKRKVAIPKNAIKNSIEKCEIFFNPYKLSSISLKHDVREKRIDSLERFFSVCQVLDDFCDIEEDLLKHNNHNLFTTYLSPHYCQRLLQIKSIMAPSLLKNAYIFLKSKPDESLIGENPIFNFFFDHSIKWLKWKSDSLLIVGEYEHGTFDLVQWCFDYNDVEYYEKLKSISGVYGTISDIRPEFMQAYFNGAKKLSDF